MSEANKTQVGGSHYKVGNLPEHWDLVIMYQWDYFQGQITKYLMRWKTKHDDPRKKLEDLKKARHFLDKYIESVEENPSFRAPEVESRGTTAPDPFTKYEALNPQFVHNEAFLCEGGWGDGTNLYTCRSCRKAVYAGGLVEAAEKHLDLCTGARRPLATQVATPTK